MVPTQLVEQSGALMNLDAQFLEILDQDEDVGDAIDLNEKFLCMALNLTDPAELHALPKIELRVDTNFSNLQATGEILSSLESLKLNDSIIRSFRDIGTGFKNVKILHISRCELTDIEGISESFYSLEELYCSFNHVSEIFKITLLDQLTVLDLEGNCVKEKR